MYAEAHPTPDSTARASTGQLSAQAPHSMHLSFSVMMALPSAISNTA